MPYLMGGFPDLDASVAIGLACADAGADLVELGVPFSDPLADGPIIHAAATRALAAGANVHGILDAARRIAERLPVVLMCYANPILARGLERFTHDLVDAGVSGLIVPDLPLEEGDAVRDACDAAGLALVPLIAPTTPDDRMRRDRRAAPVDLSTRCRSPGTTGERAAVAESLASTLAHAKAHSPVPVAVGFGISTPEQAAARGGRGRRRRDRRIATCPRGDRSRCEAGTDPAAAVGELVTALAKALQR